MILRNVEVLQGFVGTGPGRVMNAADLAKAVGKSRQTINHLLRGRMESCSRELAESISGALGLPVGVLFLTAEVALAA